MAKYDNSVVNEHVPRLGNAITRGLSELVLKLMGWKITGAFPHEPKVVFIGCPHTSNWDFIIAIASMQSVGLRASWMMKKEAFFWPLGGLFKKIGGVPIDRKAKSDLTTQMTEWFAANDKAYLGITPEGTRSKVEGLKKGYLRIAYAAKVPVFLVAIDGKNKTVVLDRLWPLTGDIDVDNRAIKAYYNENYQGIRPELG
ncbi:1-acyl-sn-glycerol-3-phosphate acyltransferase [Litorimonas sp. RW-G-Af-16]|uniref:1-acyl-sn-glycerol-3-phosphate acyltransferase n=1 Tax=Litorimonas sp. RW-G-Af-16 TaxID=3241168 RepID=UPI00390CA993